MGAPTQKAQRADPLLSRDVLHRLVGDGSPMEAPTPTQALDPDRESAICVLEPVRLEVPVALCSPPPAAWM